ncbi:UNKNOWN [Stylonychia lemnae]|uniref:Uncharacterized protein n=1 Tax=Stylonychia lemnae TaxID=5949 RepID=A0A077ZWY3_STYLE|nr:UNKNOWN [Stylonychia lemnae]|eukprot:CDW74365.1 UNKNOWN [Stylonychia lemnae]
MKDRVKKFRARIPEIPLSKMASKEPSTVSKKRRPYMAPLSKLNDSHKLKRINQDLKSQLKRNTDQIWENEKISLRNKFFVLDHTAEVLENYRRIQENEIFNHVLHEERDKKAFLRRESRKAENLIDNYDYKFGDYKYLQSTENNTSIYQIAGSVDIFYEQTQIKNNQSKLSNGLKQIEAPSINQMASGQMNEFQDYKSKQKELQNFRIEKMLTPRSNNPDLQKYLEDKAAYETASLGETSADELTIKSAQSEEDSDKRIDIIRENSLANEFDHIKNVANQVEQYEQKVVDEYKHIDVYRAKGKSYNKINFNDLTVHENLNYIKFNLKTSTEAFQLFEQIKEKYGNHPEIPAAIVQKLANKSNIKRQQINKKLLSKWEYKSILRSISQNIELLDNKQLVDTIFSIGKLHKRQTLKEIETDVPQFYQFFNYFVRDMLKEAKDRINELQTVQVAYLAKGVENMRKILNDNNKILEKELREVIKTYSVQNAASFDPYSVSKVLRYLYTQNDGGETSLKVYEALGMRFYQNLKERRESMREMTLDDPLIDIEMKDILDLIRVYSVYAKPEKQLFVPQLFLDESLENPDMGGQMQLQTQLDSSQIKIENLNQLSKAILSELPDIIQKKSEEINFSQISDLMFHYTSADMMQNKNFIYFLEKTAEDQLILREKFITLNSARLIWGFGKFMNRRLQPRYNQDIGATIINRYELTKVPSVSHKLQRRVVDLIIEHKKAITTDNLALSLYANASVGFYDRIFFADAFQQFTLNGQAPSLKNIGYFAQSMALLRNYEHFDHAILWLEQLIINEPQNFYEKSGFNIASEFSFVQTLQALTYLDLDKVKNSMIILQFLDFYAKSLEIEMTETHINLVPSTLWSLMALNKLDQNFKLMEKCLTVVQNEKLSNLSFSDCVLMNQVFNEYIKHKELPIDPEQRRLFLQLGVRQDQIEQKSNIDYYKKVYGDDIVYQLIQSFKFMSYDGNFTVDCYNPVRGGYQALIDIDFADKKYSYLMANKFDTLRDTKILNTYERIRREQYKNLCKKDGRELIIIDYKVLGLMFKSSLSKEEFRQKVSQELIKPYQ